MTRVILFFVFLIGLALFLVANLVLAGGETACQMVRNRKPGGRQAE